MATKGDVTRDRLLEAAVREASTIGLEGLSIGALARDAAMSKSGVFAHFGSKEELQIAVLGVARDHFIAEVFQPALAHPRGEPRLRALFERWLDWQEGRVTPGGCPILVASYEFDDRPGPVRDEIARLQSDLLGMLARTVQVAVESGHFRSDLDVRQTAYELHGIVLAYHLHHRLLRSADARARAHAAFESLLRGVRAS
jgi:AcrR family transcriptional regulator